MTRRKVVFRADASLELGSGHVMRCLTLADVLRDKGVDCTFVSRGVPGNMLDLVRERGFAAVALRDNGRIAPGVSAYDWQLDLEGTAEVLEAIRPDWLVVDHYSLDSRWEDGLKKRCGKVMAIDDLADRSHCCDLLLDQNLGRDLNAYAGLVPSWCKVLAGTQYALLRHEFAEVRPYSLQRRDRNPGVKRVLVSMGGIDMPNATGAVLDALQACSMTDDCAITVIMGRDAPWLPRIKDQAECMPWATEVLTGVADMAALMADSDVAIGAAGGTSWERCCLGLPTVVVVLADNQRPGARALHDAGAAINLGEVAAISKELLPTLCRLTEGEKLNHMSMAARTIADGLGAGRVVQHLVEEM